MELIKALGLNWPTFISQLINFGILYFLLKKFALEKLVTAIEQRQKEIEMGLVNAKAADESLAVAQQKEAEILSQARVQAQQIIAAAKKTATEQESALIARAQDQAATIVADGQRQVVVAKEKMLLQVRGELAEIVSAGVAQVVGEKVAPDAINQRFLEKGLS